MTIIEGEVVGVSGAYATVRIDERQRRPYVLLPALKNKHHVEPGDRVRVEDPVNGAARVVAVIQ